MYLVRQPDGTKEVQVYQIPRNVLIADKQIYTPGARLTRGPNTPRSWRYDSVIVKPQSALRSTGVAAIDTTEDRAVSRLKLFLIAEKYGD